MWIFYILLFVIVIKILFDWSKPKTFPPGPCGLPIINNILDLMRLVNKTGSHGVAWCHLAQQYGPIVGLRLGLSDPLIIVSGRKAIIEMLGRCEFDGRPNGFMFSHRTMGEKRGILFTDGKAWMDHRKFSLRCLKEFGWCGQTMENLILEDAENLKKILNDTRKNGVIKNFNELTSLAVLNSLWSLLGGYRYDIAKCESKLTDTLRLLNYAIKQSNVSGGILNHLPFLRYIAPNLSGYNSITVRLNGIWSFFSDEVTSHKQRKEFGVYRDFIDAYLDEIQTHQHNSASTFNEMQLIALLKDLFTAGVDTTNNSIGFTIGYLTIDQRVQDKIHDELDRIIGREHLPSITSRSSMPYLNATLTEVLRLSNIGPTTIPHRSIIDTTLGGYNIKKNYTLLANLMSVHLDKEHWGDPENFRPERFIDNNGLFINDPWIIAFGSGRRKCLGEVLARNTHFLFVACLLQKFKFTLPSGQKPPTMIGMDGFTLSPPIFDIIITPR